MEGLRPQFSTSGDTVSTGVQVAEFQMRLLSNERRFILAVVAGELKISNRKKAEIEAQLEKDGYDRMPANKKVAPLATVTA